MTSLEQGANICKKFGNLISLSISFQLHSQVTVTTSPTLNKFQVYVLITISTLIMKSKFAREGEQGWMLRLPAMDLGPWNGGSRMGLKDFSLFIQKI